MSASDVRYRLQVGGLPRALIPIYVIVFLDVLGLTILIPLLPALAQKLHSSPAIMGVALSVTAVCATLSSPLWGGLSDKLNRKIVLQCSQGFSLVGYVLLALANSLPLLFVSRAVEGLGGGNLGVAQSYIADVTSDEQREKAFAFSAAAFGAGFVIGPVLAGQLLRIDVSVPFWLAAALQALNFILTARFLPGDTERSNQQTPGIKEVARDLRTPQMFNLMCRQFLYIFSFTYFFTVFTEYLQREMDMSPVNSSLFLAVAGAVGAAVQVFAVDRLTKRFGQFALSEAGFALGFAAYAAMFFIGKNLWVFVAILVVWAISGSVLRPTLNALISQSANETRRGAIMGFADSLNNFSMIVAPAAGGVILGVSPAAIGVLPAVAIAGAFVLGLVGRRRRDDAGRTHGDSGRPAAAAAR